MARKPFARAVETAQMPEPSAAAAVTSAFVRGFAARFAASVPGGAASAGHYAAHAGDRFAGEVCPVPDGLYRVHGGDWVFEFRDQRFFAASRAVPPHFGGTGVIEVSNG